VRVLTFPDASQFLEKTQAYLERQEVVNGLMLGLGLRLRNNPPEDAPYYAAIEDDHGLALAALMTPPHRLILHSHLSDPSEAIQALIESLRQQTTWTIPGVVGPAHVSDTFVRLWGQPYRPGMYQRVYELREVIHPPYPPGAFRAATLADCELVAQWIVAFQHDIGAEASLDEAREIAEKRIPENMIYLWDNQQPVSMAAQARPTQHGITVNLVYTPPDLRRKGYATACVARLSQRLLDAGYEYCTLFTDLANLTSNSIYQQIGYRPVCDFNEYNFVAPTG
jgi:hypothetical protein